MGVLNAFEGQVNKITNKIKNPFDISIEPDFDAADFPDGFKITEILQTGETGEKLVLAGNWMPKVPFTFGGSTRMKKDYYSGYSEPAIQIFGPEESDITINGLFKDKRFSNLELKNISSDVQQQLDGMRIRGNIVRIQLGEFERYAVIENTKFDMERLSRIGYQINFSVIGLNAPKNAKFLQRRKEIPFGINKELIDEATAFQIAATTIPDSIPRSIGDIINSVSSDVASSINVVTNFVDAVFSTVQDIQTAVNRVKGLIAYAQKKLDTFKRQLGSIAAFGLDLLIPDRYEIAGYTTSIISYASLLTSLLERLRAQFSTVINDLPLARKFIRSGDTLQKIAVKYYGNANDWKKIYDYNDLTNTDLVPGSLLEIPRL